MIAERHSPIEKEPKTSSRIVLEIFRHGEKENAPEKSDDDIALTDQGKAQAMARSRLTDASQAVAFGSPRLRTRETAAFMMAGSIDGITGDESIAEIERMLNDKGRYGFKTAIDEKLNFVADPRTPLGAESWKAAKNGRYFEFLVSESDVLARDMGDMETTTYSRAAASIAKVIEKYLKIAPRFDAIVRDPDGKYQARYGTGAKDTMERYLGTHQGNAESFIAKYLEITKGIAERDRFVAALRGKGFDFAEGCRVDILTEDSGSSRVRLSYSGEHFQIDEEVDPAIVHRIAEGA